MSYNAHNYWSADYHRNNLADELSLLVHLETTRRLDHAAVRVVGQYWLSKCTLCAYLMCNLPLNSSECFTLGEPVLGKELEFNSKSGMHFSIPGIEIWNAFLNSWNWNLECIPQFLELISGIHSDFGKSELELELEKNIKKQINTMIFLFFFLNLIFEELRLWNYLFIYLVRYLIVCLCEF